MTELHPCPHCRRHVRRDETTCPFCAQALAAPAPSPGLPAGRLTRAAVFAGATLAATACGSGKPKTEDPQDQAVMADAAPATETGTGTEAAAPDAAPAPSPIPDHAVPK